MKAQALVVTLDYGDGNNAVDITLKDGALDRLYGDRRSNFPPIPRPSAFFTRHPFPEFSKTHHSGGRAKFGFPKLMQDYLKHDGCLLLSDDPNSVEIADNFELIGSQFGVLLLRSQRLLAEIPDDSLSDLSRSD